MTARGKSNPAVNAKRSADATVTKGPRSATASLREADWLLQAPSKPSPRPSTPATRLASGSVTRGRASGSATTAESRAPQRRITGPGPDRSRARRMVATAAGIAAKQTQATNATAACRRGAKRARTAAKNGLTTPASTIHPRPRTTRLIAWPGRDP